ncbi:MAG: glyoxalase/bleomycin resistance/extradiol dioxygenase family protein [Candidatus Marinimicrobia bacterium]|nr:glyoxalase/bleomycin resistance/extradiol dioxygenase family protein [Candidatus Neomarinimicrobiota bacterium]
MKEPQLQASHPVLMERDVSRSIRFYERLGFERLFGLTKNNPDYAGIRRDEVEIHLQWHDEEQWNCNIDRPIYRFVVSDVDALHTECQQYGADLQMTDVMNTEWGTREFHLRDPEGNGLQFYRDS